METERRCTKCDTVQTIENFHFSHKKAGYRRHECLTCESERKNSWYNANYARETHKRNLYYYENIKPKVKSVEHRKYMAEYQKNYYRSLKKVVYDHYGYQCACCGESEPMFLTIDHVNNDGYAMRKYKGQPSQTAMFLRWLIDNGFPDEYQILCMNCNFGKARNGGVCPHQQGSTTISQESTPKRGEARRIHLVVDDDMVSSAEKSVAV